MLTRLAIAVVNSVNCAECNEWVSFDATYSHQQCIPISGLWYMPRGRVHAVPGISVVKTDCIVPKLHDAVPMQLHTRQRTHGSRALAIGLLFIASVSVDELAGG